MTQVPAGWRSAALGDLLTEPLVNGRSVPTRPGGFPVLRLTALKGGHVDLGECKEGAWSAAEASPYLVREGDFLVARGNGSLSLVGRGGLVGPVNAPVAFPDTLIRVRLDPGQVDRRFLALQWSSEIVRRQIESQARTTAGIYKVNQQHLRQIQLPIPPVDEQRRIVEILGDHLSRLDAGVAATQRVRRRLGLLRTARLSSLMRSPGEVTRLGSVADAISGPAFRSSNFGGAGDGIRLLRGDNIVPGSLRWDRTRTWPESLLPGYKHLLVDPDDVILAMDRPMISAGLKLAIVENADTPALLVQRVARLRAREAILPRYLYLALQAPEFSRHLRLDQVGTQIPHITLEGIRSFQFPLPPLEEQARALETVAEGLSLVQQVDATLLALTRRAEALTKALLAAAFSGRLMGASQVMDRVEELADV